MAGKRVVTMVGSPVTLLGEEVKLGQKAADFKVITNDLKDASLKDYKGRIKLIASVPSLDTPICDLEIKRFNDEAAGLSDRLAIIFISMDLPFAQKRFCHDNGIKKVKTFSDHRTADFGMKFGTLIKEARLLSRALFILDGEDIVRYAEYVPEIAAHPDYTAALEALKRVIKDGKG